MDNMKWETVELKPHNVPKGKAYARITLNSITFNAVAASFIENIEAYPWAIARVGTLNDEPHMLGFQFVKEQVPEALPVKKQSKKHKGVTFFSRELIKRYFGFFGLGVVITQVEKIDNTTLAVKLLTEEELGVDELKEKIASLEEELRKLDTL